MCSIPNEGVLGDACDAFTDADCYDAVPHSVCDDTTSQCVCADGYYTPDGQTNECVRRK